MGEAGLLFVMLSNCIGLHLVFTKENLQTYLCLTAPPPARGATLLPGLFAAPTDVELAGTGYKTRTKFNTNF